MSSNNTETAQQRRERLLAAQAERQRLRDEEIARQEAEFAAEMERLEEEAAREEEEKVAEEKRKQEEIRLAEVQRREKERLEEEAAAEAEEEQMRAAAFAKLVEENRKEKEKAARELEKRRQAISKTIRPDIEVVVPNTSPRCKVFKSKAIISDESDDEVVEQPREVIPRGTKRKRTIKMIAKGGSDVETNDNNAPLSPNISKTRSTCSRCACEICHQQRQRCSWSGDNAARRSRSKRVKLDDEDVYEGPAARVGERRRAEGVDVAEQLARIAEQNQDVINLLRKSIVVQEQMLGIMARAERRVIEAMEESEKGEDEDGDEDGEGEEDEEEIEEVKRREEIHEGKKRAE
ncbi:hypothetical protein F5890DRAFT_1597302 [Lentinula detonsa]|uniref:Uncharacterized protein n=1 Tax=Lentinula detonsa TaxID=2804962 RepID=A0AA38PN97_9AGAR|nr:hypothetical protein F5890DRAFT_1597440 [Lentinula detonsa]KAJ3978501.1 hypothetical protein F5890DRAFT_1597302 [Lentinula detonsa]